MIINGNCEYKRNLSVIFFIFHYEVNLLPLTKSMELEHLDVHHGFYLAVNELIADKTQNIFFFNI